jgi:pimeloyl-ACP methyl ester carboxylesterase
MLIINGFAPTNGISLHYGAAGEGPLLLFVHGFPELWYAWINQLHEFGRDYHAVAPDLRGFNLSDKPNAVEDYRVGPVIKDLIGLADHFGAEKFTLVAHDWGGAAAWALAARYPQRLHKLVIINSPHAYLFHRELTQNPAQAAASAYMTLFRLPKAERVLLEFDCERLFDMMRGAGGKRWMKQEDRWVYETAWRQKGALTGGLNYYRASPLYPAGESGPGAAAIQLNAQDFRVTVPTLVIWGMLDPALLPGNIDGLEQFVPDLRIERIANASHWIVHEQPELVNRLIRDFIQT